MDRWERFKTISTALAAIATPLVVAFVGYLVSTAVKEREVQGQFVELAVRVLQEQPKNEARPLREWAVQVLDRYSGVPLPQNASQDLIGKTPLPRAPAFDFLEGRARENALSFMKGYCANPPDAAGQKLCGNMKRWCGPETFDRTKCESALAPILLMHSTADIIRKLY